MKIRVRYFASLADLTGVAEETVEVARGSDAIALWSELTGRHPRLEKLDFRPMVACDMEYADWDRALDGVEEVAFLPPVSGG